jgi:hypothetical protein
MWQTDDMATDRFDPRLTDLQNQLLRKIAKSCYDETQRHGKPARAFHQTILHLAHLMDMPPMQPGDFSRLSDEQCAQALEMLKHHPLPALTVVR